MRTRTRLRQPVPRRPVGFTLIELLVVMGIIVILIGLTVISVGAVARESRLSSGTNTVKAALGTARALAMKNGRITLVTFRPRIEGDREQYLEALFAEYSGQSLINRFDPNNIELVDRFVPVAGSEILAIPKGIKVAQPWYGNNADLIWITQSHIPAVVLAGEAPNRLVAVMFAPNGELITRNSRTDSTRVFVDFNNDGLQRQGGTDFNNVTAWPDRFFFQQTQVDDEPFLNFAPMLAVFNDDQARERYDTTAWSDDATRNLNLTAYITEYANRVIFNRYTGVVMR